MQFGPNDIKINNRTYWIGISACLLLGLFLRLLAVGTRSFDSDEVYELNHLSLNAWTVAKDGDGFPPLFRWLLSWWMLVSGPEYSRLFSVLFGLATVVVCSVLARRIGNASTGLGTAFFGSISAHQVTFGQSLRAYTIQLFAVSLVMLAGWLVSRSASKRNWAFLVLSSFFALGTHYYSAYFLAATWVFVFCHLRRDQLHLYVLCAIALSILCIPWIFCLRIDLSNKLPEEWKNKFDFTCWAYLYLSLIQGWAIGPSSIELLVLPKRLGIIAIAPWAVMGFGFATLLVGLSRRSIDFRTQAWLVGMLAVIPILSGAVTLLMDSTFASRYVAGLSVPLAILIGGGMTWTGKMIPMFATYGLIAINLLSVFNRSFVEKYDRENYRSLVAKATNIEKNPAIIVLSCYTASAVERELLPSSPLCVLGFGTGEPDDWKQELLRFRKKLAQREKVFLVVDWMHSRIYEPKKLERMLYRIDGVLVERVSNTTSLYVGRTDALTNSLETWEGDK